MTKQTSHKQPKEALNPFSVIIDGFNALFKNAQSVGLFFVVLAVIGLVSGYAMPTNRSSITDDPTGRATEHALTQLAQLPLSVILVWAIAVIVIALFVLVVSTMIHGIGSYAALRVSQGKSVTLGEAFNAVLARFGQYFLLVLWMNIKIMLWTLLLIIPGIIAYYRYSFAGMVFFDTKKLTGDAAIQESNRLAKGGLMTLFASQTLFNLITLFYAEKLVSIAGQAILYREYVALDKSGTPKPPVHVLSWLTLALPFIGLFLAIGLGVLLFVLSGVIGGHVFNR